jgi:serine/threonine protein kinase
MASLTGFLNTTDGPYILSTRLSDSSDGSVTIYLASKAVASQHAPKFALKVVDCSKVPRERYVRAIENCKKIHHSYLLNLSEPLVFAPDYPDLVLIKMEYIEQSLLFQIQEQGPFPEPETLVVMTRLVGAVQYLHTFQLIHNGISLDHILWRRESREPVLIGWSQITSAADTNPAPLELGDDALRDYLAPEISRAHVPIGTQMADIWALGKCFSMMVDLANCSSELNSLIGEMMADDPSDRPDIDFLAGHPAFTSVPWEDCRASEVALVSNAAFDDAEAFDGGAGN